MRIYPSENQNDKKIFSSPNKRRSGMISNNLKIKIRKIKKKIKVGVMIN